MISDGVLGLERAGALDVSTPIATSFLFGSPELYAWADGNHRVSMLSTPIANDPARIAAQPRWCRSTRRSRSTCSPRRTPPTCTASCYSGFGGQSDFVVGALHSTGGQAIIALRSWHPKASCSTIIPLLRDPVTSFQHTAVVTEQGTAELVGRTQDEQASALIERAAHPDVARRAARGGFAVVRSPASV